MAQQELLLFLLTTIWTQTWRTLIRIVKNLPHIISNTFIFYTWSLTAMTP
jgi:hypothetical protein